MLYYCVLVSVSSKILKRKKNIVKLISSACVVINDSAQLLLALYKMASKRRGHAKCDESYGANIRFWNCNSDSNDELLQD